MAAPVEFPEQNHVLGKPADMTDAECGSLPCFINDELLVAAWKLTDAELAEVARTGIVYLGLRCPNGHGTPAHWVTGTNPFVQPEQG